MSDLFRMGPSLLGQVRLAAGPKSHANRSSEELRKNYCDPGGTGEGRCDSLALDGDSSRRPDWGRDFDEGRWYCDPAVDPNCPLPLVSLAGDPNESFQSTHSQMQTPPMDKCNPAWDPGCPRPQPNRTLSPYVPSSYLMGHGTGVVYQGSVSRPRPKDRSGRRLYL
jgi:hypothetical protein